MLNFSLPTARDLPAFEGNFTPTATLPPRAPPSTTSPPNLLAEVATAVAEVTTSATEASSTSAPASNSSVSQV